ncbi:MAG: NUDIX domain-containing protein [Trueperaceae bacterium]|nr:NUDIX domain-containing protein [Trueperaceae bacterium]
MTDPSTEPLDVLDAAGVVTGRVKPRAQVHVDGDWHRAIHIWVVRPGGLVLVQRRSWTKDLEGGKLDVSVGGHVRAGEPFVDSLREAEEELGLTLRPGQVEYLGTVVSVREYPGLPVPLTDREHQDVYVTRDERPLDEYRLQLEEVEAVYEVPVARAVTLFRHGEHVAAAGYDSMRRPSNALLYEADLPSQGRELLAESLERVAAYLNGEGASDIAQRPFGAEP